MGVIFGTNKNTVYKGKEGVHCNLNFQTPPSADPFLLLEKNSWELAHSCSNDVSSSGVFGDISEGRDVGHWLWEGDKPRSRENP